MKAYKIKYHATADPGRRWSAGILGISKEDCIEVLKKYVKFPFQIENIDDIGDIHAISEKIVIHYVKQAQNTAQYREQQEAKISQKEQARTAKIEQAKQNFANEYAEMKEYKEPEEIDFTKQPILENNSENIESNEAPKKSKKSKKDDTLPENEIKESIENTIQENS